MKLESIRRAASHTRFMSIGLGPDAIANSVSLLSKILANQHVLYVKTRNFHWNLTDTRFASLHELFENQYREIEQAIDETAERIRMLGAASPGSLAEFRKLASLDETPGSAVTGDEAIRILVQDHEQVICSLREAVEETDSAGDVGTADFLTGLLRAHEKTAWILRSHFQ